MHTIHPVFKTTLIFVFFVFIFFIHLDSAQEEDSEIILPRSIEGEGVYANSVKLLIDGQFPAEGSSWDSGQSIYWESMEAHFVLDLGGVFQITGLLIQVDGNDDYNIDFSQDGTDYIPLIQIREAQGNMATGLDTMSTMAGDPYFIVDLEFDTASARFIKVYATGGDGHFSVSEVQVHGYRGEASGDSAGEDSEQIIRPAGVKAFGNHGNGVELMVDGRIPYEESEWNGTECVFWHDRDTFFVIDLGDVYEISGITVQVDSDDSYRIEYSIIGDDYVPLMEILSGDGEITGGMDTMSSISGHPEFITELEFFPVRARFIRIFGLDGNNEFSVSEVQIFGRSPSG